MPRLAPGTAERSCRRGVRGRPTAERAAPGYAAAPAARPSSGRALRGWASGRASRGVRRPLHGRRAAWRLVEPPGYRDHLRRSTARDGRRATLLGRRGMAATSPGLRTAPSPDRTASPSASLRACAWRPGGHVSPARIPSRRRDWLRCVRCSSRCTIQLGPEHLGTTVLRAFEIFTDPAHLGRDLADDARRPGARPRSVARGECPDARPLGGLTTAYLARWP